MRSLTLVRVVLALLLYQFSMPKPVRPALSSGCGQPAMILFFHCNELLLALLAVFWFSILRPVG